jgi:hypothetical protein
VPGVSIFCGPFWLRFYLCHTCSYREILRVETPGQGTLDRQASRKASYDFHEGLVRATLSQRSQCLSMKCAIIWLALTGARGGIALRVHAVGLRHGARARQRILLGGGAALRPSWLRGGDHS